MASLLGALLEFLRILRSSKKGHYKRFPRPCWALLLAYLGRKLSKWWCSWFNKPGAHGNANPTYRSFPGGREGSCSVSCSSSARGYAARVAASTVPASAANSANHEGAEPSSATLPANPPWVQSPDLNVRSHWVGERSHTNHGSGSPTFQSAGDRPSAISISRSSSRASVQSDRPTRDPRATYRQFGSGASRGRSSRSPSPISPQISTGVPSSPPHTRDQSSSPTIHRTTSRQRTTSIDFDVQHPSTESLPNSLSLIGANAQESTAVETSTRSPSRISFADRWGATSQHSYTTTSAPLNHFMLPEGRILQLINSDQIPRYTKNITTQVDYFFMTVTTQSSHVLADLVRKNCALWNP
jgi:hypothetical protein